MLLDLSNWTIRTIKRFKRETSNIAMMFDDNYD